eukprot:symbB.v1.2.000469.t1/scaffold11.1/size528188/18
MRNRSSNGPNGEKAAFSQLSVRLVLLLPILFLAGMVQHPGFLLRQAFSRTPAVRMRVRERGQQVQMSLDSPLSTALQTPWCPQQKPLPERLVRLGHCMLVPALGSSKQDDELATPLKGEVGKW